MTTKITQANNTINKTLPKNKAQVVAAPPQSVLESETDSDLEMEEICNAFQQYHTIFQEQRKTLIEQKNKIRIMETAARMRVGELKKEVEEKDKQVKEIILRNKLMDQEILMYKNKEAKRANSAQKENVLQNLIKLTELKQKSIDSELISDAAVNEEALKLKLMFD